jgi:tetratricopeptide (TPR) repeat protein
MTKQTYKKWNNLLGWAVCLVAALVYLSTIERSLSFWDCGEYIASAVKLEVTHAPGAALFQTVGAFFGLFAFGKGENYALVINAMSGIFSALTILFLYFSISHLTRRLLKLEYGQFGSSQAIITYTSGVVGALCFCFSDTFWYSAVEGEVYSMASLFIALLVWLIGRWEDEHQAPDHHRWIILIFFVLGLSIGVHMMCMLATPAVCFIYYARKYSFTWKSFLIANLATLGVLGLVFKGIFPLVMSLFGKCEIFFVNSLGFGFHSGTIVAFILLIALCIGVLRWVKRSGKALYYTAGLSLVFMLIGFSCWMVIPIRANANPPMNLNNPDNAIGMLDYYNRVQYGDWPTAYGENYTAYLDSEGVQGSVKTGDEYEKDNKTGRYIIAGERGRSKFSSEHVGFMPRMFNSSPDVMANYISMYGAPDFSFNYASEYADAPEAKKMYEDLREKYTRGTIKLDDYMQVKPYNIIKVKKPTLWQNLEYFFDFQNGYYFSRYLMWNYVGRQNDLEGRKDNLRGNWISGIDFIDDMLVGEQSKLPAEYRNESTVYFFFLPLLLGLIGFFFQLNTDFERFYAILALFILTSIGIVFYTGVKPFEPRERDYAMVGAFYAFAIWIGLGVAAIFTAVQKFGKTNQLNYPLAGLVLAVPLMMGFQNYNPHDRSGRSAAKDFAVSSLAPLDKNAMLFVYGDNDTYPLWGLQETEGFRNDVKVINTTLLNTSWNIDQVRRRTYQAPAMPSQLTHDEYRNGKNEYVYLLNKETWQDIFAKLKEEGVDESALSQFKIFQEQESMDIKAALKFLRTSSPQKDMILSMMLPEDKVAVANFLPVSSFTLPVNKANAIKSGALKASDVALAEDKIEINFKKSSFTKADLMMFDMLANFDWKQSVNFSSGGVYDNANLFYLQDYLQFDGFSYKLVPIKTVGSEQSADMGRIDALSLYHNIKNKFAWGGFGKPKVHMDESCTINIINYRVTASRAALALAKMGEKAKAKEILELCERQIPAQKYNDPKTLNYLINAYMIIGQEQKAIGMAKKLEQEILTEYQYFASLPAEQQQSVKHSMGRLPVEYSFVVGAVSDAYRQLGQPQKGYDYVLKALQPIDKKYEAFAKSLEQMGKVKAREQVNQVQSMVSFYQMMFDVVEKYDSTYQAEKMDQIARRMMKLTE